MKLSIPTKMRVWREGPHQGPVPICALIAVICATAFAACGSSELAPPTPTATSEPL